MKLSVFISYSHKDEAWKDRLVAQLSTVIDAERIDIWHDRRIEPGSEWFTEIETAINTAAIAVCLISQHYLQSTFCTQYEVEPLLARRERYGLIIIPVLVDQCEWKTIHWLRPIQMLPRDGKSISGAYMGREDEVFEDVTRHIAKVLDDPAYHPPVVKARKDSPAKIDLTRLPYTGFELVGRNAQLAHLGQAWRSHGTNLIGLYGWGGIGKTTLVNKWLEDIDTGQLQYVSKAFAWSFSGDFAGQS